MKTIAAIQQKGGAGRSTLATNLAGALSASSRVLLIDCDMPQGTALSWGTLREEAGRSGKLTVASALDYRELVETVDRLGESFDFVILDTPPRVAETLRAALALADLILVPIGASMAELWATVDVVEVLSKAREIRPLDARLVWMRHRPSTKLAQGLTAQATDLLGLPTLASSLAMRVAYPDALGTGRTVAEVGSRGARDELAALAAEVRGILTAATRRARRAAATA